MRAQNPKEWGVDMKQAALITGSSRGIGYELAKNLLSQGWTVFGVARDEKSLLKLQREFPDFIPIVADFTKNEDIEKTARTIKNSHLPLTLSVQNAGMKSPPRPLHNYDCESIDEVFLVNLLAPMKLTALLVEQMSEMSRILYVTSRAATLRLKESSTYCASKAGLDEIAAIVRQEIADKNIGVACVIPGEVDTKIQEVLRETTSFHLHQQFIQAYEGGHLISPQVCAKFLQWLLCDMPFSEYKQTDIPISIYDTFHHQFWLNEPENLPAFPNILN